MNFIGAVSLMYVLIQKVGVQPFLVEGGVADRCLKRCQNKMTHASPLDEARQHLTNIANEQAITAPVTSIFSSPVEIWIVS